MTVKYCYGRQDPSHTGLIIIQLLLYIDSSEGVRRSLKSKDKTYMSVDTMKDYMSVDTMKDYKVKLRNLHVSDALGWSGNWNT